MKKNLFILVLILMSPYIYSTEYKMIELERGETLWRISKRYGISLKELCELNNIEDATKIKYGTKIKIPINNNNRDKNSSDGTEYEIYTLKKNETLWRISRKYDISVDELCRINNITDLKKIKAGAKIKIPIIYQYYECIFPLKGNIEIFSTYHFSGIYILTDENKENRRAVSINEGYVSYIDNIPGYGTTVFIRHDDGYVSIYSGLDEIYEKKNSKVKKGQVIGLAGKTRQNDKCGIIFSLQFKGKSLKFDIKKEKFIINR